MTLAFALAVALLTVPLAGGRLLLLGDLRFRGAALAVGGLLVQVLIISILPEGSPELSRIVHLASYGLVGAFILANLGIPGFWLIGVGGALNFVAIAANGGVMPASPEAIAAAGLVLEAGEFANSAPVPDPRLLFLGDVFAVPPGLPVQNVYSVGDVAIALGAAVALHRVCRSRLVPSWVAPFAPGRAGRAARGTSMSDERASA